MVSLQGRDWMQVLLNRFDNPELSEQVWVGAGDKVYANDGAVEYGFTFGKQYEIKGFDPFGHLSMENDDGLIDGYTVEYFSKTEPSKFR
jgi:hypothetical protein